MQLGKESLPCKVVSFLDAKVEQQKKRNAKSYRIIAAKEAINKMETTQMEDMLVTDTPSELKLVPYYIYKKHVDTLVRINHYTLIAADYLYKNTDVSAEVAQEVSKMLAMAYPLLDDLVVLDKAAEIACKELSKALYGNEAEAGVN